MNDVFKKMLAKEPDETVGGDYFYRVPWFKEPPREKNEEGSEEWTMEKFRRYWNMRSFAMDFRSISREKNAKEPKREPMDAELLKILTELGMSGTPIVDIAGGYTMGQLPYFLKLNSITPCLVTDADSDKMKRLRSFVDNVLIGHNIDIASFDCTDMPFADNTVLCVTGYSAVTRCFLSKRRRTNAFFNDINKAYDAMEEAEQTLFCEVYRVLKPGGIFILTDGCNDVWEYDMDEVNAYFDKHDLLYGRYSRGDVQRKIAEHEADRDRLAARERDFREAGFETVYSGVVRYENAPNLVAMCLSPSGGEFVEIKERNDDDNIIKIFSRNSVHVMRKPL